MNMSTKDPLEMLRFFEILESVSKIIRSSKKSYFIEIDEKGRYIVELDAWTMPVSTSTERLTLKAGDDLMIEPYESRRGNGLAIQFRDVKLNMQDIGKHKIVELDDTNAVVFRDGNRWGMFLGTSGEDFTKNVTQIDRVFEAMKKPARKVAPVQRHQEVSFGF